MSEASTGTHYHRVGCVCFVRSRDTHSPKSAASGAAVFVVPYVKCYGKACGPAPLGAPMVNVDGNSYVEYEVRNINASNVITSDMLYLMQISTNNYSSSTLLSSTTQNEAQLPGSIIPDGNGGVLATWTISPSNPPVPQYPYQIVDVTAGVVGTPYNLPFSPPTVTFGQSPILVLGQSGVAFATDTSDAVNGPVVASFNVSSGFPANWTYQATPGDTLSIIQATSDGGVTINDAAAGGVIQLSSTGSSVAGSQRGPRGVRAASSSLQGAVPFDLSTWISIAGGAATAIWSPDGSNGIPTILAQSASPMPHGNQQGQSLPPFCQRANVNCALAPYSDIQTLSQKNLIVVREVAYRLFSLQNGTLTPLYGNPQIQGVKIEEWEANPSNPNVSTCSWQNQNNICESPNTAIGGFDGPGQITDDMGAGNSAPYTVSQQFLVDRQGLQVFWPNPAPVWYGAWGTPSSTPPGFQPNQTASVTTGWATISQINVNINAPTACPSGCDTTKAQAGPPQ